MIMITNNEVDDDHDNVVDDDDNYVHKTRYLMNFRVAS
jgi:hypothetical protein